MIIIETKIHIRMVLTMENVYRENGFNSRKDYLLRLSETYGVPFQVVEELAELLTESEDFDGLVCAVEEAEGMVW
jgi:hypothetical protein